MRPISSCYSVLIVICILAISCKAEFILRFQSGNSLSSGDLEKLLTNGYHVEETISSISFSNSKITDNVAVRHLIVPHSIMKQYYNNATVPCVYYFYSPRSYGSFSFCNRKFNFHRRITETQQSHNRLKRSTAESELSPSQDNRLTLELYLVADRALAIREKDDAMERLLLIAAHAAALLHPVKIELSVVGGEIWDSDRFPMNQSSNAILADFQEYRRQYIKVRNDNAQLFTARELSDGRVGNALRGSICSNKLAAGITVDHYEEWVQAAVTLAHELGHSLGLQHDDGVGELCRCIESENPEYCIMHSQSLQAEQPTHFSNCSISQLKRNLELGLDLCLLDKPTNEFRPMCGNYRLDEGEECDCGSVQDCPSECCDPSTCKLVPNAQCYQGSCCDVESCELLPAATECRSVTNYCDLPEFCTGVTSTCPNDVFLLDGATCNNDTAHCYNGDCNTHNSQCRYVWGDDSHKSIDQCYSHWNIQGKYFGNCGYTKLASGDLDYTECRRDDAMCGLLQCASRKIQPDPKLKLQPTVLYHNEYRVNNDTVEQCNTVIFNTNVIDPGLVSDGVKCGANKFCMNQRCVLLPSTPDHCNCSNHGVCNSEQHCHCDVGFDPISNCSRPGDGGSIDSGPLVAQKYEYGEKIDMEGNNSLTIGLCVLFLVILPSIVTGIILFIKRDFVRLKCERIGIFSRMSKYLNSNK